MKHPLFFLFFILFSVVAKGQNTFEAIVKDSLTKETLTGVSVVLEGSQNGSSSDAGGIVQLKNIPDGPVTISFSLMGYKKTSIRFVFPSSSVKRSEIFLSEDNFSLNEIIVSTTRTNSRIEDLPVKMEVIGPEDVTEESSIVPANISSLLGDVAGLQVQQTSSVNGNTNIRIQGLDGKYTQILRDGLPLYEGFSGGFGVLDIPPLDLKQIEIIKGSASTLFGGGAIAGLINLISKEPGDSNQLTLSLNQTSLQQTNLGAFASGKKNKTGFTFYSGGTYQKAVDVDGDGFSDQPENKSISLHPKLFFYFSDKKKLHAGYSGTYERKTGGDMKAFGSVGDSIHTFLERNESYRHTIDFNYQSENKKNGVFIFKGAGSIFDHTTGNKYGEWSTRGVNLLTYTELSYLARADKHSIVTGVNFISSSLDNALHHLLSNTGNNQSTIGVFVQDDWKFNERFTLETGIRMDRHSDYGYFLLPRISFVSKWNKHVTSRMGAGYGYKTPSSSAETLDLFNSTNFNYLKSENSVGANGDVNYTTFIGDFSVTLNQSFFYTRIDQPIIENPDTTYLFSQPGHFLVNADGYTDTKGSESYIRMHYMEFEMYIGYVYSQPQLHNNHTVSEITLAPHDKFAATCVYEAEHNWKFGFESSYIGEQFIDASRKSPAYWLGALMIQKRISKLTFTLNCENLFDFRQTKKENIVILPYSSPAFKPLWAPIDGRVINLSLKLII
ncbi:MAG: TonB-dependent receptor [Bacteroidetes bacterium]|nr:TonB-dependent receptor [Bacteroidota bacterium]